MKKFVISSVIVIGLIAILYRSFFYVNTSRFEETVLVDWGFSPNKEHYFVLVIYPDGDQCYIRGSVTHDFCIDPLTGSARIYSSPSESRTVYWEKVNQKYIPDNVKKLISREWIDDDNVIINGKEINLNDIFGYDYRRDWN